MSSNITLIGEDGNLVHTEVPGRREDRVKTIEHSEGRKIIVLGLSYDTDDVSLRDFFEKYGELENSCVVYEKESSRSRGFGFVTFRKVSDAMNLLNQPSLELDGRILEVQKARPRTREQERDRRRRGLDGRGNSINNNNNNNYDRFPNRPPRRREREREGNYHRQREDRGRTRNRSPGLSEGKKLFVGKLPVDVTVEELREYFQRFGQVDDCYVPRHRVTGNPRGFGFVTYFNKEDVYKCLQISVHTLRGGTHEIVVDIPAPKGINVGKDSSIGSRSRGGKYNNHLDENRVSTNSLTTQRPQQLYQQSYNPPQVQLSSVNQSYLQQQQFLLAQAQLQKQQAAQQAQAKDQTSTTTGEKTGKVQPQVQPQAQVLAQAQPPTIPQAQVQQPTTAMPQAQVQGQNPYYPYMYGYQNYYQHPYYQQYAAQYYNPALAQAQNAQQLSAQQLQQVQQAQQQQIQQNPYGRTNAQKSRETMKDMRKQRQHKPY